MATQSTYDCCGKLLCPMCGAGAGELHGSITPNGGPYHLPCPFEMCPYCAGDLLRCLTCHGDDGCCMRFADQPWPPTDEFRVPCGDEIVLPWGELEEDEIEAPGPGKS